MGENPAIPRAVATQPATGAIRFLQARRPARFAGVRPEFGIPPVNANLGMRYGLEDARGYDYPVERHYDTLWRRAVAPRVAFDPRRAAVVTSPVGGVAPGARPGRAALVRERPERVRYRVDARRPALLVMPDVDYPGWHASVDGHDAQLRRVDYLLRGVAVPAG